MSLGSDHKHDYPMAGLVGVKACRPRLAETKRGGLIIRRGSYRPSKRHGINSLHGQKIAVPRLCLIFRG
jgi:hypothetical protein